MHPHPQQKRLDRFFHPGEMYARKWPLPLCVYSVEATIRHWCLRSTPVLSVTHRVHRVATAAFWRTFIYEGKIRPAWGGWGVHAHPLSLHLGGILGGNPDRSLKSFPPCYSQTPLQTNCTPQLLFFGLEISTSNSWEGGVGFWVNKYMDQCRVC